MVGFILAFYFLSLVNKSNRLEIWEYDDRDIKEEYQQAVEIGSGGNPYEKTLHGGLLTNQKYATLFPLYYYFLYLIAFVSNFQFEPFIDNYRSVLYIAEMLASVSIYMLFRRDNKKAVGFLAATFFVFNRWTVQNILGKQDVISILFLMISLYLLTSKTKNQKIAAFFFYGISVGMKHIGIFLAPIFLLPWINKELNIKDMIKAAAAFLIPTIGAGIFVIFKNPLAFFYSMLFSFTREPSKLNTEFGYNKLLVLYDVGVKNNNILFYLLPRLPLFLFSAGNVLLLWLRKIPMWVYSLTSLFIFIAFNPVLFDQYFTWISSFVFTPILLKKDSKLAS